MSELNTIEVADYVRSLFERVYPNIKFVSSIDGDGQREVCIVNKHGDEEWIATFKKSKWVIKYTAGLLDFMDEESMIAAVIFSAVPRLAPLENR